MHGRICKQPPAEEQRAARVPKQELKRKTKGTSASVGAGHHHVVYLRR